MAPKEKKKAFTDAERQKRRREKLKREGGYEEYKAKHARTVKKCRKKQAELLKSWTEEKKAQLIQERRKKDCLRKQKSRRKQANVSQQASTSSSQRPYKRRSSLSRAVNSAKKGLPSSATKRKAVVRLLSEELDDKDTPSNKKRLSALPNETTDAVKRFYERDDISRISPGKRDVIIIRGPNGDKEKAQKRHLYLSIKEAHILFQDEHPNVKIGSSKFAELRPQNVLLSSQTPSNVCTCIYHQNLFLALDAIHGHAPSIPTYSTNFPASCL